jgi:hypothetical protein
VARILLNFRRILKSGTKKAPPEIHKLHQLACGTGPAQQNPGAPIVCTSVDWSEAFVSGVTVCHVMLMYGLIYLPPTPAAVAMDPIYTRQHRVLGKSHLRDARKDAAMRKDAQRYGMRN